MLRFDLQVRMTEVVTYTLGVELIWTNYSFDRFIEVDRIFEYKDCLDNIYFQDKG